MPRIVSNISSLHKELPSLAEVEDASLGLIVISKNWDMQAMSVVTQANKLCDTLILLYLPQDPLDTKVRQVLKDINVELIFHPTQKEKAACKVEDLRHRIDITLLLQTVLAIMPISVFLHQQDIPLRHCFTSLLDTFPGLFTLRHSKISDDLLTVNQRTLRELAPKIYKAVKKKSPLQDMLQQELPEGSSISSINYYNTNTLEKIDIPIIPCTIHIKAIIQKEIIDEVFEVKEEKFKFF